LASSDNPQFEPQPVVTVEPQAPVAPDPFVSASLAPVPTAPPIENPVWSGWDVLLIFALTFVTMIVLQLVMPVVAMWLWYPHETWIEVAQKPILLLVAQFMIYAVLATSMVMLVEGKYRVPFWQAIRWNWPQSGWKWLALGGATLIVLGMLESLLPVPKDTPFQHLFDRPRDAYVIAIIAISFAPLLEELFFRGFMYPVLARRMGAAWAVALTALPFGLIHLPQYGWAWAAALVVVLVGVVCGVVRAVTRSVGASVLVHVGYNGTQMIIALVLTHGFRHMPKALALAYLR
jgi:membrane protease YdiL (CAAX protease family)